MANERIAKCIIVAFESGLMSIEYEGIEMGKSQRLELLRAALEITEQSNE